MHPCCATRFWPKAAYAAHLHILSQNKVIQYAYVSGLWHHTPTPLRQTAECIPGQCNANTHNEYRAQSNPMRIISHIPPQAHKALELRALYCKMRALGDTLLSIDVVHRQWAFDTLKATQLEIKTLKHQTSFTTLKFKP